MIQLSFSKKYYLAEVIRFDEENDERPDEYIWSFYGYQYLSDDEALALLDDPYVTSDTKKAISDAFRPYKTHP